MMLIDRVAVARRFQRATRVDIDSPIDAVEGFIMTPTAAAVLRTTLRHLGEHGQGAFTWTGPYGCGKSSLAAVLAALLGPGPEARAAAAGALGADLTSELYGLLGGAPEFCVIPVVGARRDVGGAIREALTAAGVKPTAGGVVADLLKMVRGGHRVLLIVDEMGKTLEHVAMEGGDVHLFQELAEAASRSDGRLLVIGILHQAFDDYAHRLAREARDEWLKVQGRFVDVPVNLAGEEQLELISRAIVADVAGAPGTLMASVVAEAVTAGRRGSADGLRERLERCWPLNPVVATLLGPLSRRRFGQNQRSIFGFLNSAEPFGFQDFLAQTPADAGTLYDTDWLWSYLRSNLEPSILASPDGHRWSTAVDAVERCEARGSDPAQIRIVKTVALVDMLRERSGLVPSLDVIGAANPDLEPHQVERHVEVLKSLSILIDRRHLGSVSIYAGSDFDLDEALTRARAESGDVDLSHLRTIGVLAPVLAKRHYHVTGALRWFDVDVATTDEAAERIERYSPSKGATGLFLLLINAAAEDKKRLAATFKRLCEGVGDRPIALGLASDGYTLRELAIELVAYDRIAATRPELRGDPVARRELSGATARCAAELEDRLRASLDATSWRVPVLGEEGFDLTGPAGGAARLAAIASEIARKLYPESPRISNELLNRTKPSSNAVAASRALMHAMVGRPTEPRLGIRDFPAEGGLYASILDKAGLHRADGDGFRFAAPAGEDPCNLRFAWQRADDMLKAAGPGASLGKLHDLWRDRPIGMREGLLPVLSLAYVMSRLDRVTIYLDEVFSPAASDFLVDRMMQNPDAIRLRWSEFSEQQVENVTAVARVVSAATGSVVPAGDPLAVSRALVGLVLGVAPWTLRTTRLSPTARRVRDLGKKASDPNKLLLDDLPQLLIGDGEDKAVDVAGTVAAGLRELMDAYGAMIDEVRTAMLDELRASDDQLEELHERAATVIALTGNYRLDAFATRLSTFDGGVEAVEGVASLAANKPTRDWVDRDVDAAKVELAALAQEFLRAEGLAHVKGRRGRRVRIAVFVSEPGRPALTTQEVSVSDRERVRAQELAEELRAKLQGAGVSRPVMLAALAETMSGVAGKEAEVLPIDDGRRRVPGA
ncbi:hypothetical protein QLH51_01120 [Sphingomonas sp. 2R-10]|uniref:ATP-binding protein n=1 Tax=Sphingomonas sp. 2R-10 TaxID=3045148 RepID=UPI000F7760F0|nr:ATP-binding protein [Sphingomonas sp. 2R-10]MDJ0275408.1 hypothetical protein [Sphingomonas sp. 2R-10]